MTKKKTEGAIDPSWKRRLSEIESVDFCLWNITREALKTRGNALFEDALDHKKSRDLFNAAEASLAKVYGGHVTHYNAWRAAMSAFRKYAMALEYAEIKRDQRLAARDPATFYRAKRRRR